MNDFIAFLRDYWFEIASLLASLVSFIVILLKRKVKLADTALTTTLMKLPDIIKDAEKLYDDGRAKKLYVLSSALKYYVEVGGSNSRDISSIIDSEVEKILTTPVKKEVKDEN